jgi:uncharacterized protein YbjT (DUF2867 family)
MKTALLAGATGLIGSQLLQLLIQDDHYSKVTVLVRKPLDISHPKLTVIKIDFDKLSEHESELMTDDVFCCLGTTMRQARTKEAFKKVDLDYPYEIASIAKTTGAKKYLLISALGADKNAGIYYNKIKGEAEERIRNIEFQTLHILRPSLLLGNRKESRSGEDAAKVFYKIFGALIPKKYKAIDSAAVARAMLHYAKEDKAGVYIHESAELQQF